jgi:PhnB protein
MATTDTASTAVAVMQLAPYIFFYGRCEEALKFYENALDGTASFQRNSESSMGADVPEEWRNKVMHATFTAPGITFMASDGREPRKIDSEEGNISLALTATDRAQGDRVFAALSAGGNVKYPLAEAPWGGRFGIFDDRFGIEWMMSTP